MSDYIRLRKYAYALGMRNTPDDPELAKTLRKEYLEAVANAESARAPKYSIAPIWFEPAQQALTKIFGF